MKSVNCTIPVNIEGLDEINAKVEKMSALMDEIKALAQSITESTVTVNLPDEH